MALVRLENISKYYGGDLILEKIDYQINPCEKIGLVGVNGCGKTTLLKIITGETQYDSGKIHFLKNVRIGYLSQHLNFETDKTIFKEMEKSLLAINEVKVKMEDLEHRMTGNPENITELTERYGELQHVFEELGGYNTEHIINKILTGLGFVKDDWDKKVSILSGGQKSRVALGKILLEKPELILLDEPTNHLDIDAVNWLEEYLNGYEGAVLIVSHDRYFLDRVVKKIIEVENYNLVEYTGNYTKFIEQKVEKIALQEKMYNLQKAEIEDKQDFIRRNIAGQKTKQAQSRRKELEKIQVIEPPSIQKKITLNFNAQNRGGNDVLVVDGLSKSFGGNKLFENLSFKVERKNRIGIVGANGTGKTTLLKILIGEESADSGIFKIGSQIDVGYYDQHLNTCDDENSVIEEVWQIKPVLTEGEMRKYLAKFLFYEDEVFLKIKTLSGGEKSRIALAKIILSGANFLILDEPTNHLDINSRIALEDALSEYDGTILMVSHDRYFLDKIAGKIIFFENGKYSIYSGNYSYFDEKRKEEKIKFQNESKDNSKYQAYKEEKKANKPKIKLRQVSIIENEIVNLENEIKKLENDISLPENYSDYQKSGLLNKKYSESNEKLKKLYEEWEFTLTQKN
jgi:ATP-binding cassette, subfamily F, member 3